MGETSDSSARQSTAVTSTLGEKKAKCQALPFAPFLDLASFRGRSVVVRSCNIVAGQRCSVEKSFVSSCNPQRSPHVFFSRAHCPKRRTLSPPRASRDGILAIPAPRGGGQTPPLFFFPLPLFS